MYDETDAERYDDDNASVSTPEALDPMLDVLAGLAGNGRVLEFASGTGRVTVPLARRGVEVAGIELSSHMARKLHEKTSAERVPVIVGDMATAVAPGVGDYSLVFWSSTQSPTCAHRQNRSSASATPPGTFVRAGGS